MSQPRSTDSECGCRYAKRCHFYNMVGKNQQSQHLRQLYCQQWPQRCEIFQARTLGKPVAITLWPGGRI
jgi:hypothetical protein